MQVLLLYQQYVHMLMLSCEPTNLQILSDVCTLFGCQMYAFYDALSDVRTPFGMVLCQM